MPGAAREPAHVHLYDELVLEIHHHDADFAVARCKVCGHHVIIAAGQHRLANKVETALIDSLRRPAKE